MSALAGWAWGTPYVFAPDRWRKGNASREPADLTWACNDCVFLLYLTRRVQRESAARNRRNLLDSIHHNLRQAKGWMREWRRGRPLTGYSWKTLSIPFGAYKHVVVLSVVECGGAVAVYHESDARSMGITMCATVPLPCLRLLAEIGAGPLGVIGFLRSLRQHGQEIPQSAALDLIGSANLQARTDSGAAAIWPGLSRSPEFDEATLYAHVGRRGPEGWAEWFNDLTLEEFLRVVSAVRLCIDRGIAVSPPESAKRQPHEVYDDMKRVGERLKGAGYTVMLGTIPRPPNRKNIQRIPQFDQIRIPCLIHLNHEDLVVTAFPSQDWQTIDEAIQLARIVPPRGRVHHRGILALAIVNGIGVAPFLAAATPEGDSQTKSVLDAVSAEQAISRATSDQLVCLRAPAL
jgi:hypothetical protein